MEGRMDYLLLARVSKVVALLGFLLPWVNVSCSGNPIHEATGLHLMTGDPQPAGALEGMEQNRADDAEPAIGVILAIAAGLIGLGASFVLKNKQAAIAVLAAAVIAIGLSFYSLQSMRSELTREASQTEAPVEDNPFFSASQQRDLARAAANAIRIEEKEGFWVSVGGFGVAGVLALIILANVGGAAPVTRTPEDAPPS
jgi:hypothetical protein